MEDGIGVAAVIGGDAQAGAGGELADDRLGHDDLGVIGLGVGGKDGHGQRVDAGRQMGGRAQGVISATGETEQGAGIGEKSE